MNEEGKMFRTATFGGFNKSDVLEYIQRTADAQKAEIAKLTEENQTLQTEQQEAIEMVRKLQDSVRKAEEKAERLERQNQTYAETQRESVQQDANSLQEVVDRMKDEQQAMESTIQTLQQQLSQARQQLQEAEQIKKHLEANFGEMQDKVDACEKRSEEMRREKECLTEMELEARKRANEIEGRALTDAQNIRMQSAQLLTELKGRFTGFGASCAGLSRQMQVHNQMLQKTYEKMHAEMLEILQKMQGNLQEEFQDMVRDVDQVADSLGDVMMGELAKETDLENREERKSLDEVLQEFCSPTEKKGDE